MDNIETYFKAINDLRLILEISKLRLSTDQFKFISNRLNSIHSCVLTILKDDPRLNEFYKKGVEENDGND